MTNEEIKDLIKDSESRKTVDRTAAKHISYGVILTVLTNAAVGIWWASGVEARLTEQDKKNIRFEEHMKNVNTQNGEIIKLQTEMQFVKDTVIEIKALVRASKP